MKTKNLILHLLFTCLLNSCVKEKDVFSNEVFDNSNVTETTLIFSYLNEEFITNSVDSGNCFSINYPILLSYNTEQSFTANNYQALEEIAKSQSTSLHITSVKLPFSAVNNNNIDYNITTLEEFNEVFVSCNIPTLRGLLFEKTESCINFQYPFQMIDVDSDFITIEDLSQFFGFLDTLSRSGITPKFVFPVIINKDLTINNYFDLYETLNNCEANEVEEDNCFDVDIIVELVESPNYFFRLESDATSYSEISWTVNNDTIENETNTTLNYEFKQDGVYEVCTSTLTDDCNDAANTCVTTLEIYIDDCTDIFYEYELLPDLGIVLTYPDYFNEKYEFLGWEIDNEFIDATNNNEYTHYFTESGLHEVCLFTETDGCPQGYSFCGDLISIE